MESFIARQPIFDGDRNVYAYEMLFRAGTDNAFNATVDGDHASARVMTDGMHLHGLESLTSGKPSFINVTRSILVNDLAAALPPDQVVIELLETIEPDDEVIDACARLRSAGFTLALDDYVFEPKFEPLLRHANILKIDFMNSSPEQRRAFAQQRRGAYALLAEKVETYADFEEAKQLGYSYFQGFFFCKPEMIAKRDIPGNKLTYLRFLEQVNQPTIDLVRLEEIIRADLSLSYKLLKYLNSAAFGLRRRVESIKHGLVLLGDRPLKRWASLVALANLGDDKPPELLTVCLVRARLCEQIAQAASWNDRTHDAFLMGMFSVIDALVDREMNDVLSDMPIADDVREALLGESNSMRQLLDLARAFESGCFQRIAELSASFNVDGAQVAEAYREAIMWASNIIGTATTPAPTPQCQAS